jgi:hypothetical protein
MPRISERQDATQNSVGNNLDQIRCSNDDTQPEVNNRIMMHINAHPWSSMPSLSTMVEEA